MPLTDAEVSKLAAGLRQARLTGSAGGIAFMAGQQGRFFNGSVMAMDAGLTAV